MLTLNELNDGTGDSIAFLKKTAEKATQDSISKAWTGIPPIPTSDSQQIPPISPQQAKEQGLLGQIVDGTSAAVTGLYQGVGYGMDNLAESASHLLNSTIGTPEYEAKYITNYMDKLKRKGIAGDVAESIGTFMIGWMPWARGVGLMAKGMQAIGATKKAGAALAGGTKAGKISANFIASSLAGGTAFSPDHENLANAVQKMDGYTGGVISEAFATNPNDPRWKNRLRNGLIDGGFGAVADLTLVPLVKAVGTGISKVVKEPIDHLVDRLHTYSNLKAVEVQKRLKAEGRAKTSLSLGNDGTEFKPSAGNKLFEDFDKSMRMPESKIKKNGDNAEKVLRSMEKDGSLASKFGEAVSLEEKSLLANNIADQLTKKRNLKLGSVEVGNLKWAKGKDGRLRTTIGEDKWSIGMRKKGKKDHEWVLRKGKEVKSIHPNLAHAQEIMAKEAGVDLKKTIPRRTHEQLYKESQRMFDEVGIDAEAIKNLPDNMGWNDAQMFTFGKLVQNTEKEMLDALSKHGATPANDASHEILKGKAISAIANHADAITFLNGASTSAGRSLAAVKAVKRGLKNSSIHGDHIGSPNIVEILKSTNLAGHDIDRMTQMILHAYQTNGAKKGSKSLIDGLGKNEGGGWNQFVEAWINQGLLSNPATHALNTFSGFTNIAGHVGSQVTAAFISKLPFVENKVLFSEAFGSMYGMMAGMTKAMRLAFRAGMTNEQVVTKGAKIENYGFKHLAAEHVGKGIGGTEDLAIGLGIDLMGTLNRIPGRFLLLEDEFVKSIAYDTMLHSKAWKYAFNSQKATDKGWLTTRQTYTDIINSPKSFSDDIGDFHSQSQDLANLVTFQRDVGDMVNRLSGVMQNHPYLKLFVPFLKVLTNIPKYVVQHSPLGVGMQNEAFKQGGTARMLEIGRMGYGTMIMMYGAHLYNNGNLKGTGTRDFRQMMNQQGLGTEHEMSLRAGDKWIKIGRVAPVVNFLSFGADVAKGLNTWERDPEAYAELIGQVLASGQNNLVSGTWAPNLHKLLGVIAEPRDQGKQWSRAVNSLVGTMQPAFVRANEKRKNPNLSNMEPFGMEVEDIEKSTNGDFSKLRAKFMANSSHSTDEEAHIYPTRNVLGDIVRSQDQFDDVAGILNNPVVSFLTFKKANDNPILKHLFGGSDHKVQTSKQGRDLELSIPPLSAKILVGEYTYKMTPEELDYYQSIIGKATINSRTLLQNWTRIFENPLYKDMPRKEQGKENDRTDWMMDTFNKHKAHAKNMTIYKFNLYDKAMVQKRKFRDMNQEKVNQRNSQ